VEKTFYFVGKLFSPLAGVAAGIRQVSAGGPLPLPQWRPPPGTRPGPTSFHAALWLAACCFISVMVLLAWSQSALWLAARFLWNQEVLQYKDIGFSISHINICIW